MLKILTKKSLIINLMIGFILFSGVAFAHPPSTINATFDQQTKILTIQTIHNVPNPSGDHYIQEMKVKLNGKDMIIQYFLTQTSSGIQEAQYLLIDAHSGDTIEVYALCNKFGDKTITLKFD